MYYKKINKKSERRANKPQSKVDRVLGFFSSRSNWNSPTPSPAGECVLPPLLQGGGGTHSLAGEWVGGLNSDKGTDSVVL
jgi:hypothetical protein